MGDVKTEVVKEAAKIILEASKATVTAVIDVIREIKNDNKLHQQYINLNLSDIEFFCKFILPYTGKDSELIPKFPPELSPHLEAADKSLKKLESLLQGAKELQSWNPLVIIKKIYGAQDFKQKFDVELKNLEKYWNAFNEAGQKASSLKAWQEIFLIYPHAGLFWFNLARIETHVLDEKFYTELIIACGGSSKSTLHFPSLFLKGYVSDFICEPKTNQVTVQSFKTWLGLHSEGRNTLDLKVLIEIALRDLAIEGPEFKSPGRKLYQRAKGFLNHARTSTPVDQESLKEAKRLFEEYAELVEEKVPLLREPLEDRHLFYLWEIEQMLFPGATSALLGKWQQWCKKYRTLTPRQKAQSAAVNHYYEGEAYLRKAKMLLGEPVDDDKKAQEDFKSLPNYKKIEMNTWKSSDLQEYLKDVKLSQYSTAFEENNIDGSLLINITEDDLKNEINIEKKFHRLSILNYIKSFSPETEPILNTREVEGADAIFLLQSARAQFDLYNNVLKGPKATKVLGDKSASYLREIQRLEQKIAVQAKKSPFATSSSTT